MGKYIITFSKENGGKYYRTNVEADTEQEAFIKARDRAESQGIKLPDEVWTRIEQLS